jgi:hypothetical protein
MRLKLGRPTLITPLSSWITLLLFLLLIMVTCDAPGCSWGKKTDTRELSRHRASCHFYKKFSILSSQKRQECAKEAVSANAVLHVNNFPSYSTYLSLMIWKLRESAVWDQSLLADRQQRLGHWGLQLVLHSIHLVSLTCSNKEILMLIWKLIIMRTILTHIRNWSLKLPSVVCSLDSFRGTDTSCETNSKTFRWHWVLTGGSQPLRWRWQGPESINSKFGPPSGI